MHAFFLHLTILSIHLPISLTLLTHCAIRSFLHPTVISFYNPVIRLHVSLHPLISSFTSSNYSVYSPSPFHLFIQITITSISLSLSLSDPAHGQNRKKAAVRYYSDWEAEPSRFHPDISFASDSESRHKATPTQLHRIPETERAGSALTDAMEAFLPYRGGDSHCSSRSHSTDSSIDIAFVSCKPSVSPNHQSQSRGRRSGGGVYRASRGCVSPDSVSMMKPLQPVQRKSKSLNGLQLDSIDSHLVRSPVHPRLVRQSSAKSRLRNSSPERHHHKPNADEVTQQLHKVTQHNASLLTGS